MAELPYGPGEDRLGNDPWTARLAIRSGRRGVQHTDLVKVILQEAAVTATQLNQLHLEPVWRVAAGVRGLEVIDTRSKHVD